MKKELVVTKIENKSQSIKIDDAQSFVNSKEGTLVLLALLEGLSYNVMSGDVWFLSAMQAADIATKRYGIASDAVTEILNTALKVAQSKGKTNPVSSMF